MKLAVREQPGLASSLRLGIELAPLDWLPLELSTAASLPSSAEQDGSGAHFFAWTVRASACALVHADVVELGGCAGVDAGTLLAAGYGLDDARSPARPWVDVTLRARVGVRVGAFGLRVEPGLSVPLSRDAFVYESGGATVPLFTPGVVAGTLDVIASVQIGS